VFFIWVGNIILLIFNNSITHIMKTQVRNSGNISTGEVRSFEHTLSADSKMDSTLTIQ